MRRVLTFPSVVLTVGSSILLVLGCLGWLDEKFGFLGFWGGLLLAPIAAVVVPIWRGLATGNWWMLAFFPTFWLGAMLLDFSRSGERVGGRR